MKRENGFRFIILLVVIGLAIYSLVPSVMVFMKSNDANLPLEQRAREIYKRENPKTAAKAINLGLDLAGGTHIIVEINKDKLGKNEQADVTDRCLEIIRNRVDQFGLSEPLISKSGENRIVADLAGMGAEDAKQLIGATALLEFKLVSDPGDFRPILDKIDGFLSHRKGDGTMSTPANDSAKALQDVFGNVIADSTKAIADSSKKPTSVATADSTHKDSAKDTAASAANQDFVKNRPFAALLVGMGRDVGVKVENVDKVKKLLADVDVQKLIPPKFQFLWSREVETQGVAKVRRLYLLKHRAEMTGNYIADATFNRVQGGFNSGEMEVALSFKGLGPKEFARITGANIGKQLAIVLDSVVYSAPVIQGRIANGRASITGVNGVNEAKQLSVTLRAGSLPAPMQIVELRSVGPTLGEQNINKGLYAAFIALFLVAGFMFLYYRGAGLIADLALVLNLFITFAVLGAFHATLTLPGIAGIVLTMGIAVDANVLIFERIREELRAGRSVRAAIDAGYQKAFSAIFDSNLTTFGTALILWYIGTGPIKGFGLTLMIGIVASMYTAIGVTHLVFDWMLSRRDIKELSIGKGIAWFHKVDLKVIPRSKQYVGVSIAILLIALGAIVVRGLNFGIDFTGGNVYQVKFDAQPNPDAIRSSIEQAGFTEPKVQTVGAINDNELLISITKAKSDSATKLAVQNAVGSGKIVGEESVGPTVGKDLRWSAIKAILLSWLLIIFYIWFRFGRNGLGFGIGGVLGIAHDSLITLGLFAMFGREISLDFVAAILTIIGYSLNDSIIIFDRIRELTGVASSKESFASRVNSANNQCLSRSIITHLTVLFTVLILAIFGGSSIRDFNIAMTIGVVVGTYSTIAVACPFVVWWDRRQTAAPKKA